MNKLIRHVSIMRGALRDGPRYARLKPRQSPKPGTLMWRMEWTLAIIGFLAVTYFIGPIANRLPMRRVEQAVKAFAEDIGDFIRHDIPSYGEMTPLMTGHRKLWHVEYVIIVAAFLFTTIVGPIVDRLPVKEWPKDKKRPYGYGI